MSPLVWLDYAGVAVFAVSGALAAGRAGGTAITFAFFAAATGIGGGTLRDLLLGAPVFWVRDPGYVAVCMAGAALTWAAAGAGGGASAVWRRRALLWLDAVGLAAYAVVGAAKAAALGVPPLVCVVMGVLTACFGGIVRDVLAGQPSVLLPGDLRHRRLAGRRDLRRPAAARPADADGRGSGRRRRLRASGGGARLGAVAARVQPGRGASAAAVIGASPNLE